LRNENTHIATDSAGALRQIRNSILNPQRMKRHKHAKHLESIVHHIQLSKDTIHLYKFKDHAGILGNGCAGAVAKCLRKIKVAMIFTINTDAHPHSSISGQQGCKTLPQLTYQILYYSYLADTLPCRYSTTPTLQILYLADTLPCKYSTNPTLQILYLADTLPCRYSTLQILLTPAKLTFQQTGSPFS